MTELRVVDTPGEGAADLHVGVVVASWNAAVTDRLLEGAVNRLEGLEVGRVTVLKVPGSLELPVGARALAEVGCDAVVALGTIIRGDTDHYKVVVEESARGLTLVSLEKGIPVANGVLAVHDIADAVDRAQLGPANKGHEAASAAVDTALLIRQLGSHGSK